jgi:hypothetical protein
MRAAVTELYPPVQGKKEMRQPRVPSCDSAARKARGKAMPRGEEQTILSAVSATALPKVDTFKPMTLRVMNFDQADDGNRRRGFV